MTVGTDVGKILSMVVTLKELHDNFTYAEQAVLDFFESIEPQALALYGELLEPSHEYGPEYPPRK